MLHLFPLILLCLFWGGEGLVGAQLGNPTECRNVGRGLHGWFITIHIQCSFVFCVFCTRDRGVFFVCFVTAEGCPLYSIDLFRYLGGEFGLGKGGGNLLGCGDWLMRWCAYQINMKQSIKQTNKQTNKL